MEHIAQRDWSGLLHGSIPLTAAMGVGAQVEGDGRVRLKVPLHLNHNDKGTGFGGSVATLATLAGWVEVRRQLDIADVGEAVEIVVQRGQLHYLLPINADFSALVDLPDPATLARFVRLFARAGLARLPLTAAVCCQGEVCARFDGEFVARRTQL
ncbi:YiiD C-terminal domain-containing protein [Chitinimonas sp.]|uniref:YiiD C-terminal domain-containing protein n=1 Tax=Chitinimonas sp. TaxID=1934313 RepID=UPI0035B0C999